MTDATNGSGIIIEGATPAPAGGNQADLIKDGTIETFEQDVLAESMQTPIIVDFWATWCGPCKQLTPALETAVREAGGKVRLVKIDIDKNQMLASQLRIQSVPTVYGFVQGQPVDGFMGAVPASEIKAFIDRLMEAAGGGQETPGLDAESLIAAGDHALNEGDLSSAAQLYAQLAQAQPDNLHALAGLARCYVAMNEIDKAKAILETVPPEKQDDPALTAVRAAIDLAGDGTVGDRGSLEARLALNPDDLETRFELANALIGSGAMGPGIDHLLTIMEKDRGWNDDAAKQKLLTVFDALGPANPIVKTGRRRLSSLYFS